jgi:hypothetical protein
VAVRIKSASPHEIKLVELGFVHLGCILILLRMYLETACICIPAGCGRGARICACPNRDLGVNLMRARQIAVALLAFLIGSTVAALALWFLLPSPPGPVNVWSFFAQTILLSLLGPILFAWAWGPGPMGFAWLVVAFGVPITAATILILGYFRKKSLRALVSATLIWSVFGGFSAYVGVTGSI